MMDFRSHRHASSSSTSDPFVVLAENQFAHTAVMSRGTARRVVYIHGPSGVGKSHLVGQFVRDALRRGATANLASTTAADFAAQLAEASDQGCVPAFQQRFQDVDVFVCEDVHAIEGRPQTQWQLLWLIDQIATRRGQLLFTARKMPGELNRTLAKLTNRFHGGVCAGVLPPGIPSRCRLIEHFAMLLQIPLTKAIVELLAGELAVSPRELRATVTQLDTMARLHDAALDLQFAKKFLIGDIKRPALTIPKIARAVASHFGVSVENLRAKSRRQGLMLPRHCAMSLCRRLTDARYSDIGEYFGRRSHSTVVHACARLQERLANEPTLRQSLLSIDESLREQGTL